MTVIKTEKNAELVVKRSRFLAYALKCEKIGNVKALVSGMRTSHPGANHVVHAAVVGNEFSFSDDKEPKNTAGRPVFEVLKGSGISNICVLVVRYFGGTLLGTGGLVKAYGDATKLVLKDIETEELLERTRIEFSVPYPLYDSTKRLLSEVDATNLKEEFLSQVEISLEIPSSLVNNLRTAIKELSNGQVDLVGAPPEVG